VKQGPDPSVARIRVRAEHRRRGHGGNTKPMAYTRHGNKERGNGEERPGGVGWGHTPANDLACAWTGLASKNRVSARWWCVQASHRRRSHGDGTTPTTCARQGFVLTRLQAKEKKGLGSTVACSACGCRRQTGARRHTSNKGTTQLQGNGARAAMTAAAPAKRPARLDGRLSSDGGSARRRGVGQRATHKQRAHMARSSLGSKAGSTTREGFSAHLAL
jgi:hypothetical protein